ncbi:MULTISPECIES: hypothetical protein [Spirosoma]|uniref:Uncharacterized protein n=1 Tax=Spirosoma sordidisoli TaxID=2502893 RepID=A0A4Q2UJX0_9BACT|nr:MULTISPECIES: hypothetical protein [Spirosoma]RYC69803.1 hypothetical protein EQG79_14515 [Spirosoma sordidisoli]
MEVTISRNDLQTLLTQVVAVYVEQLYSGQEILISQDYFWNIEQEALYNVSTEPSHHDMGSLHDAVIELKMLVEADDDYIPSNIDIRRISYLLRYLSGI